MNWDLLFWAVAVCVWLAPFLPALREWRFRTDVGPLRVSRAQDVNVRHFAHSFFDQVSAFFDTRGIDPRAPPPPHNGEFRPGEEFAFLGAVTRPRWPTHLQRSRRVPYVVIATGDLLLEGGMTYQQEIYCGGQLYAGSDSTFRAVYAGTDLLLGARCVVARWLHSQGHVHIGQDSRVYGRISSGSSITLGEGTRFERLNAALIRTAADEGPPPAMPRAVPEETWVPPASLRRLDDATVHTATSLSLPGRLAIDHAIVCQGTLEIGDGTHVARAVKAHARLVIGPGCVVRGALVCEGPIVISAGAEVAGPVVSETSVAIATGVTVGSPDAPTTVTAPDIHIAVGSQCSGTLWARRHGRVDATERK